MLEQKVEGCLTSSELYCRQKNYNDESSKNIYLDLSELQGGYYWVSCKLLHI